MKRKLEGKTPRQMVAEMNAVVHAISYTGYDMEDASIIIKSLWAPPVAKLKRRGDCARYVHGEGNYQDGAGNPLSSSTFARNLRH